MIRCFCWSVSQAVSLSARSVSCAALNVIENRVVLKTKFFEKKNVLDFACIFKYYCTQSRLRTIFTYYHNQSNMHPAYYLQHVIMTTYLQYNYCKLGAKGV